MSPESFWGGEGSGEIPFQVGRKESQKGKKGKRYSEHIYYNFKVLYIINLVPKI